MFVVFARLGRHEQSQHRHPQDRQPDLRVAQRTALLLAATQEAAVRAGVDPTTAAGMNSMTPAQLEREMRRQDKELAAATARAERETERQRRAQERAAIAESKARQKTLDTALRTGGKVVTSRLGQDIVRGIFGTLFGGGKSR